MKFTIFADARGNHPTEHELDWGAFTDRMRSIKPAETKEASPLISMCTYGTTRLHADGILRNAQNVTGVYGVELDYDGELIEFEAAADMLRRNNIKCFMYTTARHKAKTEEGQHGPRFRILAPFAERGTLTDRDAACERLYGLFNCRLARESFSHSQSFYIGPVEGVEYQTAIIEGDFIDKRYDLPRVRKDQRLRADGNITTETQEDLIEDVKRGEPLHPAIAGLAMRGWSEVELYHLAHQSAAKRDRPSRFKRLVGPSEIPGAVNWAREKRLAQKESYLEMLASRIETGQDELPPPVDRTRYTLLSAPIPLLRTP